MTCCETYNIDCRQGRDCPARNTPLHTKNGGSTVVDGQALHKPVYKGSDIVELPASWFPAGLLVVGLLLMASMLALAYRVGGAA